MGYARFMIKQLSYALFPYSLCVLLLLTACITAFFSKKVFFVTGALALFLLIIFGNYHFSQFFLNRFEKLYPPLKVDDQKMESIDHILVLAALSNEREDIPITSQLGGILMVRLAEGIRLQRKIPAAKLIFSGSSAGNKSDAKKMEEAALELGVSKNSIILEEKSSSTYESAILLKDKLSNKPFILVTSARHMPRAISLFQAQGTNPIAAPTDHLVQKESGFRIWQLIPRAKYMRWSSEVFYELLAYIKIKLGLLDRMDNITH